MWHGLPSNSGVWVSSLSEAKISFTRFLPERLGRVNGNGMSLGSHHNSPTLKTRARRKVNLAS